MSARTKVKLKKAGNDNNRMENIKLEILIIAANEDV
jgi:hypothetical protein